MIAKPRSRFFMGTAAVLAVAAIAAGCGGGKQAPTTTSTTTTSSTTATTATSPPPPAAPTEKGIPGGGNSFSPQPGFPAGPTDVPGQREPRHN